jgi:hypothetical protein
MSGEGLAGFWGGQLAGMRGGCVAALRAGLWMLLGWSGVLLAADTEAHFRLEGGSSSTRAGMEDLQLVLLSARHHPPFLTLRVGYRQAGAENRVGRIDAPSETPTLAIARHQLSASHLMTSESVQRPLLGAGLRAGTLLSGSLTFRLPEANGHLWREEAMTLTVPPFLPCVFRLQAERRFEPRGDERLESPEGEDWVLQPIHESLAYFPVTLHEILVTETGLQLAVSVVNESRFSLTWAGTLGLRDMRLLTSEGELLAPLLCQGEMADTLAPRSKPWEAGQRFRGQIQFPLPHPHSGDSMTVVLPGFTPLVLRHRAGERCWAVDGVAAAGLPQLEPTEAIGEVRMEQQRFDSAVAFFAGMSRQLQQRDQAGYLRSFLAGARERQAEGLTRMLRVPISWVEFEVPDAQKTTGDERALTGLVVELHCLLAGLPRENRFITRMECDLRREQADQPWRVVDYRYLGRQPFWELGFTEIHSSEHFISFYQPGAEDALRRAADSAGQLEKAYRALGRTGLPLGPRYAAFVIPRKEDFQALTGRDPGTFSGATSAAYHQKGGRLRIMNQAMYLNDSYFGSLQRHWGKQDRVLTIQHELVHLALAEHTRPWTPVWLVEGLATHLAGQHDRFTRESLRRQLPGGAFLRHLTSQPFIGANVTDHQQIWVQYQYSAAVVRWIEKQFGAETLLGLYRAFGEANPRSWPAPTAGDDRQLRESEEQVAFRLELLQSLLPLHLEGWQPEQVDAATRMSLR